MQIAPTLRRLQIGILIPIALLIALAAISYRSVLASSSASSWVKHTNDVMAHLSALMLSTREMENGSRGYALIGEKSFLTAYESGRATAPIDLAAIGRLTVDNPVQTERARKLAALVDQEGQREAGIVQQRREIAARTSAPEVAETVNVGAMQGIRELIVAMQAEEERLLSTRQAAADLELRRMTLALSLGGVVALIALAFGPRIVAQRNRLEIAMARSESEQLLSAAHAKDLAVINQELEAFSYSVSHDLRAPLRHINGYVELLQRDTAGKLTGKAVHYLATINQASIEAGRLVDDLLAFSRVGRAPIKMSEVSLNDVIKDAVRGLDMPLQGRNIVWNIARLPDVIGDAAMLRQVFSNLIDNAVKYSRTRETANIEIGSAEREGNLITLFVRDNGVGFDMKYVGKLFGVFERLHASEQFEGTGIGLATVRRIVARHGGHVHAEGAIDVGATFYLTLELAHA
jgi:signal transduction histidine kinase